MVALGVRAVSYERDTPVQVEECHGRALGIGLLSGPRRKQFLMSGVPLHRLKSATIGP